MASGDRQSLFFLKFKLGGKKKGPMEASDELKSSV